MDIDWIKFCEGETCNTTGLHKSIPAVVRNASPRLLKKGNAMFIEKNGKRFDLTGHRIK
jgi:alpha-galactosidase